MANQHFTFASLEDLRKFFADLPEGSTASGIASDLEAGNIDEFSVQFPGPDGKVVDVSYIGPVVFAHISRTHFTHETGPITYKMIIKKGPTSPSVLKSWIEDCATTLRG